MPYANEVCNFSQSIVSCDVISSVLYLVRGGWDFSEGNIYPHPTALRVLFLGVPPEWCAFSLHLLKELPWLLPALVCWLHSSLSNTILGKTALQMVTVD